MGHYTFKPFQFNLCSSGIAQQKIGWSVFRAWIFEIQMTFKLMLACFRWPVSRVILYSYCSICLLYICFNFLLMSMFCDLRLGTASHKVSEPCSVYTRRQSADKRKSKGKEVAVPMSCFPAVKTRCTRYTLLTFFLMFLPLQRKKRRIKGQM